MTLTLEVNGSEFKNFTSSRIGGSIDAISGSFQFEAASEVPTEWPIKAGDAVVAKADGNTVLTGFVEVIEVDYYSEGHRITISGRSKTADVIDSTANIITLNTPISLPNAVQEILFQSGIDGVQVTNLVGSLKDFEKGELIAGEPGQNVFSLIEQYARKRQVLVTTNFDGGILLTRNTGDNSGIKLFNKVGNNENNILEGGITIDLTQRFATYEVISQQNVSAFNVLDIESDIQKIVDQKGVAEDSEIRSSRNMVMVSENASDDAISKERAKWEANIRRSRGTIYTAVVLGHTPPGGGQWETNRLVQIDDDFCNVSGLMLLDAIEYIDDLDFGNRCRLRFVAQDAYTLQENEPQQQQDTNTLGGIFKK